MSHIFAIHHDIETLDNAPVRSRMTFDDGGTVFFWVFPNETNPENNMEERFNNVLGVLGPPTRWYFRSKHAPEILPNGWNGEYGWIRVPDDHQEIVVIIVPEGHDCNHEILWEKEDTKGEWDPQAETLGEREERNQKFQEKMVVSRDYERKALGAVLVGEIDSLTYYMDKLAELWTLHSTQDGVIQIFGCIKDDSVARKFMEKYAGYYDDKVLRFVRERADNYVKNAGAEEISRIIAEYRGDRRE